MQGKSAKKMKGWLRRGMACVLALWLAAANLAAALPALAAPETGGWITNLEDLHPVGADLEYRGDGMYIRKSEGSSLSDALAISESRPEGKYVFESDVTFDDGNVANLIFGAQSYETTENSFVFKLDRNNRNETKIFYFSGAQKYPLIAGSNGKEFPMGRDSYHMKVVVDGNQCTGYVDGTAVCTGRLPDYYMEGYLGLGAAEGSAAHFQNTQVSELDTSGWITDLTDVTAVGCYLEYDENGIRMNAEGESYLISGVNMGADESFIYETDVRFVEGDCVGLLFGASGAVSKDDAYVFYMNRTGGGGNWWNRDTRLWKFNTGSGDTFFSNDYAGSLTSTDLFETNQEMYHLKLVVDGGACWAYIDGRLAHHYTLPQYAGGYLGIRMDGTAYFQNTKVTRIDSYDVAEITDIQVEDMILTPGFNENDTEYSVLAVPYEKESVQITVTASGENAVLYIDGREAESGEPAEVPLEVGKQVIPIRLEDRAAGTESSASVSIYRKQSAASYKTEAWRDQYHFSPLEGWMNDPNGLIYYNDQWHLFYQYIPLTRAHSDYEKHWGHAVSDDLVHWEELPVALAPDELGSIWSGSTVNDPENKSGLFAGPGENNLLAFFTHMNSSGQVQSVAYSEDGGVTWKKYAGNPILTQEDDPLHDGAFRDPNVFWCEEAGKYLMVVAGGPVRIFSSDNLLDWEFESGYNGNSPFRPEGVGDIYSECPDLFPLAVDGDENNVKWVYTGAGRWYMIGDLKEIDGHWSFIPETGAISMTMAPDSYAGVTFKNADGGRVVMVSWMADWGTIQNAPTDGWNGTYTLCYDLSLRTTEDGIRLFQEPVKEYETLRGEPLIDETDIVIEENGGNILSGCRSDQFELVAHLEPEESVAEVGFRMFVGTGQEMVVKYNPQTSVLTMDRSRASAAASEYFGGSSSYTIHKNDDGSVDLRIFVDKGSVEVIPNHGEIYGAMLVFPNYAGIGMEAYSTGGDTAADITIYPLDSIWREDTAEEGEPAELYLSVEDGASVNIGDEFTVYSRVAPETADQAVEWILDDPDQTVAVAAQDDISITLRAEAAGDFSLTAAAKGGSVTKTVSIHTRENPFRTNLTDWKTSGNGTWSLTEGGYQGITGHDGFAVGSETFENGFRLEMDVTVTEGTAFGIVFNAEDNPGSGAYMVNFDFGDDQYGKQFRWTEFPYYGDESNNAVARFEDSYTPEIGKKHHVELTWLEGRLTYVIDGHVIFDGVEDKNAGHVYSGGHVGVMGFNSTVVVNDVYAVPAAGLTGLQVSGAALSPAFDKAQTDYEAFVDCGTETVRVTPEAGSGVEITVSGEAVESGSASGEIALAPGENVITVTAASWNGEKTYTISVYRLPFEDVHQEDWFIDSIHYVYQRGIMIGHNEREFDPNMPMIRADTALVLYRVEGMPDVVFEERFPDVKGGLWYSEAVVWASAEGIATGYSSGLFGTADPVTREQAVTMLFRYASRKGYAVDERTSLDRFADAGQVSGFAEEAMEWAGAFRSLRKKCFVLY